MRTTVKIDDELLNEAKKFALSANSTLSAVVETALKEMMSKRRHRSHKAKCNLVTYKGRGVKQGVDLDDSAALLDLMEGG